LLDSSAPDSDNATPAGDDTYLLTEFLREVRNKFANIPADTDNLSTLTGNFDQLGPDERLNYILEQARMLESLFPGGELAQLHQLLGIFKANIRAMENYMPQLYPGRIVLFRAGESLSAPPPPDDVPDSALGWSKFSTEPVELHPVPGNHYSMLTEPQVQVVAKQLRACLDQAQAVDLKVAGG
jgi:hypothetical protein